eukprot:Gb_01809 [translate_table: standard]
MDSAFLRLNNSGIGSWNLSNIDQAKINGSRIFNSQFKLFVRAKLISTSVSKEQKSETLADAHINNINNNVRLKSGGPKKRTSKVRHRKSAKEPAKERQKIEAPETESDHGELKDYSSRRSGRSSWLALAGARRPLSKEEEQSLFQDIQDLLYLEKKKEDLTQSLGRIPSDQEWADAVGCSVLRVYARLGKGRAARRKMITANLPLVESMAKQFHGKGLSHQELCQEGALGLLTSTEKFNISFKTKFSTYAFYWIYEKMSKSLKKSRQLMKIGRPIYETASWVLRCKEAFQQFHGRDPTLDELSQASNVKKERIRIVLNTLKPVKYLDAMYGGSGADPSDVFDVKQEYLPWQAIINDELKTELTTTLELLAPRERQVVRLRYGFDNGVPQTRSEVADFLGLHYQSVMVTEKNALKKLQKLAEKGELRQYLSGTLYGRT